ncbi:MAG: LpxA family transferase [Xenophilus sp.]
MNPSPAASAGAPASPCAFPSLEDFIGDARDSGLAPWLSWAPWEITGRSEFIVRQLLQAIRADEFHVADEVAVHRSATVERGAVLKGPLIVGANAFVAAGAYLRGGSWIGGDCILGPGTELKSSFVFHRSKLAHFNFVGDSILGSGVNLEAGSIICNYRNERPDKEILVRVAGALQRTGCEKFGALVGDHSRIGANAVLAPGALLASGTVVGRTALRDDEA